MNSLINKISKYVTLIGISSFVAMFVATTAQIYIGNIAPWITLALVIIGACTYAYTIQDNKE